MERRQFLATVAATIALSGCLGDNGGLSSDEIHDELNVDDYSDPYVETVGRDGDTIRVEQFAGEGGDVSLDEQIAAFVDAYADLVEEDDSIERAEVTVIDPLSEEPVETYHVESQWLDVDDTMARVNDTREPAT